MLGSSRKVEVRGHGRGLEIWVDISIKVPSGTTLTVDHAVGAIDASGLSADLELACRSCPIAVVDVRGDVTVNTGSGRVEVSRCEGERLHIDTGSGRVDIESVDIARLYVDTGSGRVKARSVGADEVEIDTGSGSGGIRFDLAEGYELLHEDRDEARLRIGGGDARITLDTGSGSIRISQ